MNITEQLEILTAANENKEIEFIYANNSLDTWKKLDFPKTHIYNFMLYNYRIKPNQPTILHQYILKENNGDCRLSIYFYKSLEEVQQSTQDTVIKASEWTTIEIQE